MSCPRVPGLVCRFPHHNYCQVPPDFCAASDIKVDDMSQTVKQTKAVYAWLGSFTLVCVTAWYIIYMDGW